MNSQVVTNSVRLITMSTMKRLDEKTILQKATDGIKAYGDHTKKGAYKLYDDASDRAKAAGDKAKEAGEAIKDKAEDAYDSAKDKTGDKWEATKEGVGHAIDATKNKASHAYEVAKENASSAVNKTKEAARDLKKKVFGEPDELGHDEETKRKAVAEGDQEAGIPK
uniref:Uncharacterized protein n=1 Tax=Panagrolaimus sp. JU765 TaxID=591449 RepID=A0AC34RFD0_9BILA